MQKEGGNFTGNDRYEGYCVDLMELLFKKVLQITYEIQIVKDSKYGNVNSRGEWNGMVGELLTGV